MPGSFQERMGSLWFRVRQGLWFLPTTMTAAAAILAFFMIRLDEHLLASRNIHH